MEVKKITFKKATKADKDLITGWLKKSHVKEHWDNPEELLEDFETFLKGKKLRHEYWICSYDKQPFALLLTIDASEPEPGQRQTSDVFIPWLELEGMTLLIDFAICEKSFLKKGLSSETIKKFSQTVDPHVSALLADPEVKDERAVHVYEKAGFVKVATFIRGEGFFKGQPHYLMKLKIMNLS